MCKITGYDHGGGDVVGVALLPGDPVSSTKAGHHDEGVPNRGNGSHDNNERHRWSDRNDGKRPDEHEDEEHDQVPRDG